MDNTKNLEYVESENQEKKTRRRRKTVVENEKVILNENLSTIDKYGSKIFINDFVKIVTYVSKYSDGKPVLTGEKTCKHIVKSIKENIVTLSNDHTISSNYVIKV